MKPQFIYFSKILLALISLVLLIVAGVNAYDVWVKEGPMVAAVSGSDLAAASPAQAVWLDQKKELVIDDYTENIWHPRADEGIEQIFDEVKAKWGLKLSGTIIAPGASAVAFIIDASGNEGIYSEGESIEHWKIKKIEKDQVVLVDSAGEEMILKLGAGKATVTTTPSITPLPVEPSTISRPESRPPVLVNRSELISRVKPLIDTLPAETIFQGIEDITGISRDEIPPDTNLSEYVTKLMQVSQDGILREETPSNVVALTFCLKVNPDNSAQTPASSFLVSDNRIYACFSNSGGLKGLKKVVTRWTNISTGGNIVYIGNKPINPSASYNYVWVEKQKGWDAGLYQVEIFKTGTLIKIAQGRFQIK